MFPMASFLAPVDTALICSKVKKVLEGHGLEFQVMFVELATYIVLPRENILVVLGLNPSGSNVSYGILPFLYTVSVNRYPFRAEPPRIVH